MATMSAVWDRTTEFLSDNLASVVPVAALTILLPSIVSGIVALLRPEAGPGLALVLGGIALVAAIVSLWGQAAVSALALDPARSWRQALAWAGRRLGLLVGLGAILLVGLGLLMLPVFAILAAAGLDFSALSADATPTLGLGAVGGIALYLLVLLPLTVWLLARLALVTPVVLAEQRGFGSLARSFALTRGMVMRIIGVLLLYSVVALVAVLAARTVFGSILALVAGGDGAVTVASVLTAIVSSLVGAGFSVLGASFVAKLYLAARDRSPASA